MLRAVSLLWLGSLLTALLSFATQWLLARQLAPEDYGALSAALATITLLAPLAGFGLSGFWLQAFGQEGEAARRWLPASARFASLSTSIILLGLAIWVAWGPDDARGAWLLGLLALYIPGQLVLDLVSVRFQLEERHTALASWQLFPHAARLLLISGLMLGGLSTVFTAAVSYALVSASLLGVGGWLLWQMHGPGFALQGHHVMAPPVGSLRPGSWSLAARAWPFGLDGLFFLLQIRSAAIVLNYSAGPVAVAHFNVAFLVMNTAYLLPSTLYQKYLMPKWHRWATHEPALFLAAHRAGWRWMLGLGVLAMLATWALAPWAIPRMFGEDYAAAVPPLMILAAGAPLRFLTTHLGAVLMACHMPGKVQTMAGVALLQVLLCLLLVPAWGVRGAAIASVMCELMMLLAYSYQVRTQVWPTRVLSGRGHLP